MSTVTTNDETAASEDTKKKSKWRIPVPHTYAIILGIVALVGILTYLIPSGAYERVEEAGRQVVVPDSFAFADKTLLSPFDFALAVPEGMMAAVEIVIFIFLAGGAFGVIRATGAIDGAVSALVRNLGGAEKLVLPALMVAFSILGFTMGMAEEMVVFVPITVSIALALGYDVVVGAAVSVLGAAAGFIGGMFNPFTVGVAQTIAEVGLFSGAVFRTVVYLFILGAAIGWVYWYARRVKADPTKSVLYGVKMGRASMTAEIEENAKFGWRAIASLLVLLAGIVINLCGVFMWDWFLPEMSAVFLLVAIVAGLVGGLGLNGTFDELIDGMAAVTYGALIVGFARAILVVLEEGQILDTIVFGISQVLGHIGSTLAAGLMFIFQSLLNFFIPSGSGQAAATMPIMVPLADSIGMDRQVAVLAFQYGDGISNSFFPTSGPLLSCLAIVGIPYERWVKFVWPLILGWSGIALVAVIVASLMGVGF